MEEIILRTSDEPMKCAHQALDGTGLVRERMTNNQV